MSSPYLDLPVRDLVDVLSMEQLTARVTNNQLTLSQRGEAYSALMRRLPELTLDVQVQPKKTRQSIRQARAA